MMKAGLITLALVLSPALAFRPLPKAANAVGHRSAGAQRSALVTYAGQGPDEEAPSKGFNVDAASKAIGATVGGLVLDLALPAANAMAKGGEYGILEKKAVALIHPAIMFGLIAITAYTAVQGWNWRRIRTIGDEISELKAQFPALKSEGIKASSPLSGTISKLNEAKAALGEDDAAAIALIDGDIKLCQGAMAIDEKVVELTNIRKDLTSDGAAAVRDRHFSASSVLLGLGVTFGIQACFNTFSRAGKLFPGPHLYNGALAVIVIGLSASLVPEMQKGKKWAKDLHLFLGGAWAFLLAWQVQSGLGILEKVWEKVPW